MSDLRDTIDTLEQRVVEAFGQPPDAVTFEPGGSVIGSTLADVHSAGLLRAAWAAHQAKLRALDLIAVSLSRWAPMRIRRRVRVMRVTVCRRHAGWLVRVVAEVDGRPTMARVREHRTLYGANMAARHFRRTGWLWVWS